MDLSIVVPLYNEEDSVRPLYEAITKAMALTAVEYEILVIDDGSKDRTFDISTELCALDERVKAIRFRRNYGQTPAMVAGIDHARGAVIVTMDGDLQNDPADIPMFLDKVAEGFDIVVGWRHRRQDKLVTRKIPSRIANWLIGKVTGIPIKDNGCSLKAYRARLIKEVPLYSEMHRFIPAMASIAGARVAEVKVRHHARRFGQSKYGLSRIYKVLIDLLTVKTLISFASRPLYWFMLVATPFLLIGAVIIVSTFFVNVDSSSAISVSIAGTGLLLIALGIFLFGIGLIGDLVYRFGDLSLESFYKLTVTNHGSVDDTQPSKSQG